MQHPYQVVTRSDELHLLHHHEVLVNGLIDLTANRSELVLAGSDLIVLGLARKCPGPIARYRVLHVEETVGRIAPK